MHSVAGVKNCRLLGFLVSGLRVTTQRTGKKYIVPTILVRKKTITKTTSSKEWQGEEKKNWNKEKNKVA